MTVYAVAESVPVAWAYVNEDGECEQIDYGASDLAKMAGDPGIIALYAAPSQTVSQETAVEAVARALAECDGITPNDGATYALSSYGPRARAAIAALSSDLKADNTTLVGRMAAALELGHETLHQCTAVLSANDCATVAKAMLEMRQALDAFKKSEVGHG